MTFGTVMRDFAQALPRARKSQERASHKIELHQRRWWIVAASTFEGKCCHRNHFLRHICKIWIDLTSRILHQADLKVWAQRSSLCLRTVSWLVARISWACFGLTCLCQTYFVDASGRSLRLCASDLFLRRRTNRSNGTMHVDLWM